MDQRLSGEDQRQANVAPVSRAEASQQTPRSAGSTCSSRQAATENRSSEVASETQATPTSPQTVSRRTGEEISRPASTSAMNDLDMLMCNDGFTTEQPTPDHGEMRLNRGLRGCCFWIANSIIFTLVFAVLIVANIVLQALEADAAVYQLDFRDDNENNNLLRITGMLDYAFNTLFILEIVIRVVGSPVRPWKDSWLILDSLIVLAGAVDVWVSFSGPPTSAGAFRIFRVFRAFRAIRVLRVLRFVRPLRIVAEALGEAFKRVVSIVFLSFLLTWSVAIIFTSTIGTFSPPEGGVEYNLTTDRGTNGTFWDGINDTKVSSYNLTTDSRMNMTFWAGINNTQSTTTTTFSGTQSTTTTTFFNTQELFADVGTSLLTLNLSLLRGLRWGHWVAPLILSDKAQFATAGVFALIFLAFAIMSLMTLTIGMFVMSLLEASNRDQKICKRESIAEGNECLRQLKEAYETMQKSRGRHLNWEECQEGLVQNQGVGTILGMGPSQMATLFKSMDPHGSGYVSIDDFLLGLLKATRMSKLVDMLSIDFQQQKIAARLRHLSETYDSDVRTVLSTMTLIKNTFENLSGSLGTLVVQPELEVGTLQRCSHSSIRSDPSDEAMDELEARYRFGERLAKAEAALQVAEAAEQAAPPAEDLWQELLVQEIQPWLRWELAALSRTPVHVDHAGAPMPPSSGHAPHPVASVAAATATGRKDPLQGVVGSALSLTSLKVLDRSSLWYTEPGST